MTERAQQRAAPRTDAASSVALWRDGNVGSQRIYFSPPQNFFHELAALWQRRPGAIISHNPSGLTVATAFRAPVMTSDGSWTRLTSQHTGAISPAVHFNDYNYRC